MSSRRSSASSSEDITNEARTVARTAAGTFGGKASVHDFHNRDETRSVGILTCAGVPTAEYSSYSTVGVHGAENLLDGRDVRVELAGVAPTEAEAFPNLLASAAFQVRDEGWLAAPGVVFPGLVRDYDLSRELAHVLWTPPFAWSGLDAVAVTPSLTVHWLLAVPIAESEYQLLLEEGYPALERRFEAADLPYYDLDRPALS